MLVEVLVGVQKRKIFNDNAASATLWPSNTAGPPDL
jgi:hypothetical protein